MSSRANACRTKPVQYRRPKVTKLDDEATIGKAMLARYDLTVGDNRGTYPLLPIEQHRGDPAKAMIAKGSLLVYAGTVVATERKRCNGRTFCVRVLKHTFITPVGRCIVHNLNLLRLA